MKLLYALFLMLSVAVVQASETDRKTELSLLETPRQDAPSSDESSTDSGRSDSDSPEQHLKIRLRSQTAGALPSRMAAKEGASAHTDHKSGATVHFVIERSDKDAASERKARVQVKAEGKQDQLPDVVIEPTKSVLALLTDTMAKHAKSPQSGPEQRRKTVHSLEWRRNRTAAMTALPDKEREERAASIAMDSSLTGGQKVQKVAALRKVSHVPTGAGIAHWRVTHNLSVAERSDKASHGKADYHE